ncbi:DNA/RNA non-specific endonuclease [bacterium]|nr:DNA/RNA non-specific endonuclease [bacterium]
MKKNLNFLTLALLLLCAGSASGQAALDFNPDTLTDVFAYPKCNRYGVILRHKAYSMLYFQKYQLIYWASYALTKDMLSGPYNNVYDITPDPMTKDFPTFRDYKGSGYMQGFLAPPDFMRWDSTARREGFYASNTAPQKRGFNKGLWKRMEEQERAWAQDGARLWVVTGPVVIDSTKTIGSNKVRIPAYFFKVILILKDDKLYETAYLLPTLNPSNYRKPLEDFTASVDMVESMTGYDFFPLLADSVERQLEMNSILPPSSTPR